ncbi:MAG: glycosyltransferase family 9 protein [Candidatus Omnitrophica bacterium]|nr:glycosyltransferase family 9 protein [Candidatus Omnitrophota bacterium]
MENNSYSAKNILVINLGGIGDILLCTPALRAIYRQYPRSYIALLTVPRSVDMIKNSPYISDIFIFKGSLIERLITLFRLRFKRFGFAINMRTVGSFSGALKMLLLMRIIRPKMSVGRNTEGRGFFYDIKIPETYKDAKHELEYCLDLVKSLGAAAKDGRLDCPITKRDTTYIDRFLAQHGINEFDTIIGISPGAPWMAKRWGIGRFKDVARILSNSGHKVVIMGTKEEIYIKNEFTKNCDFQYVDAVGATSLNQLCALIKRCSIHITNDTGSMHIAAAVGTPVIAIFGSSHLEGFDPRKITNDAYVFYNKINCSPCEKRYCPSMRCFDSIEAKDVAEKALEMLQLANRGGRKRKNPDI